MLPHLGHPCGIDLGYEYLLAARFGFGEYLTEGVDDHAVARVRQLRIAADPVASSVRIPRPGANILVRTRPSSSSSHAQT